MSATIVHVRPHSSQLDRATEPEAGLLSWSQGRYR